MSNLNSKVILKRHIETIGSIKLSQMTTGQAEGLFKLFNDLKNHRESIIKDLLTPLNTASVK